MSPETEARLRAPVDKKVSLVMVSFNQATYLEAAILSVLDQTYQNLQLVVVDAGSTDGSVEILEKYLGQIEHFVCEPDAGPADGLNKGFSLASGEILGFLNSDDLLEPVAVRDVVEFFDSHSDVGVVSGHGWVIDSSGVRRRRLYSDRYSIRMAARGACILVQPSTYFRTSAFRRTGGFNVGNRSNWDAELFLDMALAGVRFGRMERFLSSYRVHPGSITGSTRLQDQHQRFEREMFQRVYGRMPSTADELLNVLAKVVRKATNPRDTLERVLRGPVFGMAEQ